jgi:gas vesicle protein
MKNPFEKENHTNLIAGVIIGTAAAGVAAYLMFSGKGAVIRDEICNSFDRIRNTLMGTAESEHEDHALDYLAKPHKAPKTDRDALLKHQILTEPGDTDPAEA